MRNQTRVESRFSIVPATKYLPEEMRESKFRINNMLLKQINLPHNLLPGDHIARFWSHRMPCFSDTMGKFEEVVPHDKWLRAMSRMTMDQDLERKGTSILVIDHATDKSFLKMLQFLVGRRFRVTGGSAVWWCSGNGRFPIVKLTAVEAPRERTVYSGNDGPYLSDQCSTRTKCQDMNLREELTCIRQ